MSKSVKIKIPKWFKIGATEARVGYRSHLHSDEGFNGTYNRRTGQIEIEAHIQGKKRDRTFGHELMEVIKENYNLKIEEADMSNIANGWLEFLWYCGMEFDWSSIDGD